MSAGDGMKMVKIIPITGVYRENYDRVDWSRERDEPDEGSGVAYSLDRPCVMIQTGPASWVGWFL